MNAHLLAAQAPYHYNYTRGYPIGQRSLTVALRVRRVEADQSRDCRCLIVYKVVLKMEKNTCRVERALK